MRQTRQITLNTKEILRNLKERIQQLPPRKADKENIHLLIKIFSMLENNFMANIKEDVSFLCNKKISIPEFHMLIGLSFECGIGNATQNIDHAITIYETIEKNMEDKLFVRDHLIRALLIRLYHDYSEKVTLCIETLKNIHINMNTQGLSLGNLSYNFNVSAQYNRFHQQGIIIYKLIKNNNFAVSIEKNKINCAEDYILYGLLYEFGMGQKSENLQRAREYYLIASQLENTTKGHLTRVEHKISCIMFKQYFNFPSEKEEKPVKQPPCKKQKITLRPS